MGGGAAQIFETDHFVGDRLDDLRPGDEHVSRLVDHDDKVGDGWRIDGTASTRAHDDGNLRDDTRCTNVAEENFSIGAQRCYTFLNPSATRVVHANNGTPSLERHVKDLANLETVHFPQRAPVDGEILSKGKHLAAVDGSVAGDHAIAWNDVLVHIEVSTAMFDQRVNLLKTTVIKQQFESLTGCHLPAVVLSLNTGLPAAGLAASLTISQVLESLFGA